MDTVSSMSSLRRQTSDKAITTINQLKSKSFQKNMLISIGGIFLLFAICFGAYQHSRETSFKIDIMQSRLQMYNYEMMQELGTDGLRNPNQIKKFVNNINVIGLRATVIDEKGNVLADSHINNPDSLENHLKRTEIKNALKKGVGYDIKRISHTTHETYFYSATKFDKIIVRTAVPYSAELTESLKADNTYIYFAVSLTMLLGIALYFNTNRISKHLEYLREFSAKAEKGIDIDSEIEKKLPNDELGEISRTIIMLYWKMRHAEDEKNRIKRQLTQNAAHELKTPAASIHGYLESILENPDMDKEKRLHFLERCYSQSERMNKLLTDMSTLSKLENKSASAKTDNHENSEVNVETIINNVISDFEQQLADKNITVSINLPPFVRISSDMNKSESESLIYSIFRNIFENAIAYATNATWIKILCAEVEDNGLHSYEFTISDNGPGIGEEHLPHIFERFYRVDKGRSRKLGGTGLGLAIVKNAVAAYKGATTASITPGGGLTISFTLARF